MARDVTDARLHKAEGRFRLPCRRQWGTIVVSRGTFQGAVSRRRRPTGGVEAETIVGCGLDG
jgi:hypothetical protein